MRVLISGGGPGGHLFPAIAVAQALSRKDPDATVLFAGRREGIEAKTVASYGMRFAAIPPAPPYTEQFGRDWELTLVLSAAHTAFSLHIDPVEPDLVLRVWANIPLPH